MKVKVLVAQWYPTLCNSMDYRPPVSSVHGILQARILEWIAFPFSSGSSHPRDQTWVSCIVDSSPFEPPGKPSCSQWHVFFYLAFFFFFLDLEVRSRGLLGFRFGGGLFRVDCLVQRLPREVCVLTCNIKILQQVQVLST